ncbi:MAG: hypothetical protein Ta2B_20300 [Termitinemataceae bacterium]|nr:MAG: hypothetical protein Ta2B_20300 [Termitinemataceae bacterium]
MSSKKYFTPYFGKITRCAQPIFRAPLNTHSPQSCIAARFRGGLNSRSKATFIFWCSITSFTCKFSKIFVDGTAIRCTPDHKSHNFNKNPRRRAALYFCSPGELHFGFNTPCYAPERRGIKPYGSNNSSNILITSSII